MFFVKKNISEKGCVIFFTWVVYMYAEKTGAYKMSTLGAVGPRIYPNFITFWFFQKVCKRYKLIKIRVIQKRVVYA